MNGLVSRYAVAVIILSAHIALFIVGTLTGPAPELVRATQ